MPKVTVLMSVFNGEKYLRRAIESILNQSFRDFEFLIIDDGSVDKSASVVKSYLDPRIVFKQNNVNIGQPRSLNKGIRIARGEYIARMDCDDVSLPERIQMQVSLLDNNPNIDICGTAIKILNRGMLTTGYYLQDHETLKARLLFHTPFAHPSVMLRKQSLLTHKLFYRPDPENSATSDYEFWSRCCWSLRFANLSIPLLVYRLHPNQLTATKKNQQYFAGAIRGQMLKSLGIFPTRPELKIHNSIAMGTFVPSRDLINQVENWLSKIKKNNVQHKKFDQSALNRVIESEWVNTLIKSGSLGLWILVKYINSPLSIEKLTNWRHMAAIISKLLK